MHIYLDLSGLSNLTSLEHLSLSGNQVTDISALRGLKNVRHLGLNFNTIVDISPLSELTSLQFHIDIVQGGRFYLSGHKDFGKVFGADHFSSIWLLSLFEQGLCHSQIGPGLNWNLGFSFRKH